MRIRELKQGREELDSEVLLRGRITNIRKFQHGYEPNWYRVELDNGSIVELRHEDIFGVLEKEKENEND